MTACKREDCQRIAGRCPSCEPWPDAVAAAVLRAADELECLVEPEARAAEPDTEPAADTLPRYDPPHDMLPLADAAGSER